MTIADLIDDLVSANHILYNEGVVDGFGHVSVRHPESTDRYLLARSIAPAMVTREDIMEFDLASNAVGASGARPSLNVSYTAKAIARGPTSTQWSTATPRR